MARKVNLGNLKMDSTPYEEKNYPFEEVILPGDVLQENKIKETVQLLFNTNNKILNYTIKQASQVLNISQEFIRRRIYTGEIKTINFGDKPMITIFEIARILNEGVK